MNNINNTEKRNAPGALQERQVSRLIVKPLTRRITEQRGECRKQGRRIFKKLREVDESIAIIARHLQRQAKGSKK